MTTADALLRQAFALHQAGRLTEAEPLYRNVLKKAPKHFDALHMLGVLHLQTGRGADALKLITQAVAAKPGAATALNNQGNAFQTLGRFEEALASYDRALAADSKQVDALKNRGDVLRTLERYEDALASYTRTLALNPRHADALNNRGATLQLLDRAEEALRDYERALAVNPVNPVALSNCGDALLVLERPEDALASYQQALTLAPNAPETIANTAKALHALKRFDEALAACDRALAALPDDIKTLNTRGAVLRDTQRYDEAIACFDRALVLNPDYLEALVNRGTALHEVGRHEDALASFDRALSIKPAHAGAHWNRALTLLMQGRFNEGWAEFEWRLKMRHLAARPGAFTQPPWDGRNVKDGPLLIWGEQGVGDEILYASMLDDLLARARSFVWDVDARLQPLIARSYPDIRTVKRAMPPDATTQDKGIGAQISIASLGQYLRPDAASFPATPRAYLKADVNKRQTFRSQLLGPNGKRLIGISWVSKNPDFGLNKSINLASLASLWNNAGVGTRFVNLQYGDTAAERAATPVNLLEAEGLDIFNDLDGLAALIAACDLVITVSNTTTHLAGALGVPVWVMVAKGSGKLWYWGADQTTSLWYPSATIFRQRTPGDWSEVISSIAARLADSA